MYDNIVVVGNGKTSRENVEALIDDYFYANPEMTLYTYNLGRPSEGQVWAIQYAEEKGIKHTHIKEVQPMENMAFFVLFDENDNDSLVAVEAAVVEIGAPAFDLTNGLALLGDVGKISSPQTTPQELEEEEEETYYGNVTIGSPDNGPAVVVDKPAVVGPFMVDEPILHRKIDDIVEELAQAIAHKIKLAIAND